nr:PREDICTED: uncharacterized protein LOC107075535 [Lepisosteus oculatus]
MALLARSPYSCLSLPLSSHTQLLHLQALSSSTQRLSDPPCFSRPVQRSGPRLTDTQTRPEDQTFRDRGGGWDPGPGGRAEFRSPHSELPGPYFPVQRCRSRTLDCGSVKQDPTVPVYTFAAHWIRAGEPIAEPTACCLVGPGTGAAVLHSKASYCRHLLDDNSSSALIILGFVVMSPLIVVAMAIYCGLARRLRLFLLFQPCSRAQYHGGGWRGCEGQGGNCCCWGGERLSSVKAWV